MPNPGNYADWIGHEVSDSSGDKVGKVSQIYVDDQSGEPEWLAVHTGMFNSKVSFVPLHGATANGDKLVVPYDKAKVKDAPRVEEDSDGFLTPAEEDELYRYYGRSYTPTAAPTTAAPTTEVQRPVTERDAAAPAGDGSMTLSEEQIRVGMERREAGRVRLRKYVVTESVTQTVPVSHDEARIIREPITDANREAALRGPSMTEAEAEVTLYEERPVVEKEVVAKERVRLATETVTEQQEVTADVRKERIEQEPVDVSETTEVDRSTLR